MLLFPVWMCLFAVAFTSKCHNEHSGIKGQSRGLAQGPGVRDIHVQTQEHKNASSISYIRRACCMPPSLQPNTSERAADNSGPGCFQPRCYQA